MNNQAQTAECFDPDEGCESGPWPIGCATSASFFNALAAWGYIRYVAQRGFSQFCPGMGSYIRFTTTYETNTNDCNFNEVPDECDLLAGAPDEDGNQQLDLCQMSLRGEAGTCYGGLNNAGDCFFNSQCPVGMCTHTKNRYLPITVAGDFPVSVRVKVLSMAAAPWNEGQVWWASAPSTTEFDDGPTAYLVPLTCGSPPHAQVWPEGRLLLYGPQIVPDAEYEVTLCNQGGDDCQFPFPSPILRTGTWGDVVDPFNILGQPNFLDISSVVERFRNLASAPETARADLVGTTGTNGSNTPDQRVNFMDIGAAVAAFQDPSYTHYIPTCP
jgi:hypothetical protein